MFTSSILSVLILLSNSLSEELPRLRGVSKNDIYKYQPDENGNWHCLNDSSIIIPLDRINDNYCDCPDGSDEPGTSACSNSKFFCENIGFTSHYLPSFKVDDGICDYDLCCDGSDEEPGMCENRCEIMRKEYENYVIEHNKKINEGLFIKNKLVEKANTIRSSLENSIENYQSEIKKTEKEIEELEIERQKIDENEELIIDNFNIIESDLNSLNDNLISSFENLQNYISKLELLENILKTMTEEYNHNFNDPAVKQAAQEYLNFAASIDEQISEPEGSLSSQRVKISTIIESFKLSLENTKDDTVKVKNQIINLNKEQKENNQRLVKPISAKGSKLSFLNPIYDAFSALWDIVVIGFECLVDIAFGIKPHTLSLDDNLPGKEVETISATDLSSLEVDEKITTLKSYLSNLQSELAKSETELEKNYGPDDILRAIPDCITNKIGNYNYKICPTSLLEQINSDNHGTKIGVFKDFIYSNETNNYQFIFKDGARCWNGPIRQAIVDLVCGTNQEIVLVTEPEKCIYRLKMISPIGCLESDLL